MAIIHEKKLNTNRRQSFSIGYKDIHGIQFNWQYCQFRNYIFHFALDVIAIKTK